MLSNSSTWTSSTPGSPTSWRPLRFRSSKTKSPIEARPVEAEVPGRVVLGLVVGGVQIAVGPWLDLERRDVRHHDESGVVSLLRPCRRSRLRRRHPRQSGEVSHAAAGGVTTTKYSPFGRPVNWYRPLPIGRRRADEDVVAATDRSVRTRLVELYGHPADAVVADILDAVAVLVLPDEIADRVGEEQPASHCGSTVVCVGITAGRGIGTVVEIDQRGEPGGRVRRRSRACRRRRCRAPSSRAWPAADELDVVVRAGDEPVEAVVAVGVGRGRLEQEVVAAAVVQGSVRAHPPEVARSRRRCRRVGRPGDRWCCCRTRPCRRATTAGLVGLPEADVQAEVVVGETGAGHVHLRRRRRRGDRGPVERQRRRKSASESRVSSPPWSGWVSS